MLITYTIIVLFWRLKNYDYYIILCFIYIEVLMSFQIYIQRASLMS
jgi:hypothetical protein